MDYEIDGCVQKYFESLKDIKPLTKSEERKLMIEYKNNNDIEARNKLIISNLRYACKLAYSFRGRGLTYYELISEANNGLIEAIDKYDITNDVKLICYAKWWIIQRMQAAIERKNKLPISELPSENNDVINESDFDNIINSSSYQKELIYEDENEEDEDTKKVFIDNIFSCLDERESDMLNMYYGRNYENTFKLEEIGKKYNLTKERARQIMEKAINKIRTEAFLSDSKYLSR